MGKNMAKVVGKEGNMTRKNLRFERKFILENHCLEEAVRLVHANSFCFKEIYNKRKINNIYFDDYKYTFYHQNVSGIGDRKKIRLRWYHDNFDTIINPTLETKIKYGEVGDKISFKMKSFSTSIKELRKGGVVLGLMKSNLSDNTLMMERLFSLKPALFNSYERKYYLSFCKRFRITLDFNQEFYNPDYAKYELSKEFINPREIVLELKYDLENDQIARRLVQEFNSRVSKNSKYVNGIDRIKFLKY